MLPSSRQQWPREQRNTGKVNTSNFYLQSFCLFSKYSNQASKITAWQMGCEKIRLQITALTKVNKDGKPSRVRTVTHTHISTLTKRVHKSAAFLCNLRIEHDIRKQFRMCETIQSLVKTYLGLCSPWCIQNDSKPLVLLKSRGFEVNLWWKLLYGKTFNEFDIEWV